LIGGCQNLEVLASGILSQYPQGTTMSRATLRFLSPSEIERIHETSLRLLAEVGVAIHSESVSKLLTAAGAHASGDRKRVLIPRDMVESALSSAPRSVLLASRVQGGDIRIPGERLYCANGGEGVYIKDMLTGVTTSPTLDSVEKFVSLVEALPSIDIAWDMVGAIEQPVEVKGLVELKAALEFSRKHYEGGAMGAMEAKQMVEMASVLTGGPDELAKRPIFSAIQCPISPLTFDKDLVEAQVELAKVGIPIVSMSAAVAGLTSPATISGTIAQVNAENLASLTICQVAKKGAPFVYSSDSSAGDLRSGSIDYEALESVLLRTAAGEMGRHYQLPVQVGAVSLEESALLLSRVREGVPYLILQALVPSDLSSGFGGIDQAAGASYEMMVVDAWVWEAAREFVRDFDASDSAISFDTISAAALDNNFLSKRHTAAHFKKEFSSTRNPEAVLSSRGPPRARGDLLYRAKNEVRRILKDARPVISKRESEEMQLVIDKARKG